jgi:DnaD/phage-associated family protein
MFTGFPDGKLRVTPLPDLFFSELLAQIDDLAELKVTLHVWWRLAHKASPLCLSLTELRADVRAWQAFEERALDEALRRAAQRHTLLELQTTPQTGASECWYFLNTESGRREIERVRAGKIQLQRGATVMPALIEKAQPSNIFTLYEQHIGMLTPLIAEQLQATAQTYHSQWIAEAFAIAVREGKRNWRYVEAILQRWAREGKRESRPRAIRPTPRAPSLKRKRKA